MGIAVAAGLLIAFLCLAGAVWWFGRRRGDYRQLAHSISELGEAGAPDQRAVSFGVFLPFGVVSLAIAAVAWSMNAEAALLIGAIGMAYAISAFFSCDPGAPVIGSWTNTVHNVAAAIGYGLAAGVLREVADRATTPVFDAAFVLLAAFIVVYLTGWPKPFVGFFQRLAETAVMISAVALLLGAAAP
ncbi:MAG: DUF998 domain-containing protein [Phycisphaerales bacterium]